MGKKVRYYWFLFRWFLIGKSFCDMPKWSKKWFWVIHKILWVIITMSVCYTLHKAIKYVLISLFY